MSSAWPSAPARAAPLHRRTLCTVALVFGVFVAAALIGTPDFAAPQARLGCACCVRNALAHRRTATRSCRAWCTVSTSRHLCRHATRRCSPGTVPPPQDLTLFLTGCRFVCAQRAHAERHRRELRHAARPPHAYDLCVCCVHTPTTAHSAPLPPPGSWTERSAVLRAGAGGAALTPAWASLVSGGASLCDRTACAARSPRVWLADCARRAG